MVGEFSPGGEATRAGGPCSWSAISSRRFTVPGHRSAQFEDFRRSLPSGRRGRGGRARRGKEGARIPRSVDQRQLSLVAAVLDRSMRDCDRLCRDGPWRPARAPSAPPPDRPGEVLWWPPFDGREDVDDGRCRRRRLGRPAGAALRRYAGAADPALARRGAGSRDHRPPDAAGDILILVRSRTELASLIVARLFEHCVCRRDRPASSLEAARGQGFAAAIRFAVQPEDDLNLAALLVSPMVAWTSTNCSTSHTAPRIAVGRAPARWTARVLRSHRPDAELLKLADSSSRRASSGFCCPANTRGGANCSPGSARRRVIRSRNWSRSRSIRAAGEGLARPLPRLVLPRRGRGQARRLGALERGPRDDRPRRQGTSRCRSSCSPTPPHDPARIGQARSVLWALRSAARIRCR